MSIKPRVVIKTVLCGDRNTGKTAMMFTAMGRTYPTRYVPTIGVDFATYRCIAENQYVTINMWELSSDNRFVNITDKYISNSSMVVYCFDLSKPLTFLSIPKYIKRAENILGDHCKYIVGFKDDKEHLVSGKDYANRIGAKYFEINTAEEPSVLLLLHTIAHDGLHHGVYKVVNKPEESKCCYM